MILNLYLDSGSNPEWRFKGIMGRYRAANKKILIFTNFMHHLWL